jgi:replicative DNA helicase
LLLHGHQNHRGKILSELRIRSARLEQNLLVAALENRSAAVRRHILAETTIEDFATEYGREVRRHMALLLEHGQQLGRAVDMAEDAALAARKGGDFILGTPELRRQARHYPADRVSAMLHKLNVYRRRRALATGVEQIAKITAGKASEATLAQAVTSLEQVIQAIRPAAGQAPPVKYQDIIRIIDRVTTPDDRTFVPTGLGPLDDHITGWRRGDLVVMSAKRGGLKTLLALQMAFNAYRAGCNVAFCSMEMPWNHLEERLLAYLANTQYRAIRNQTRGVAKEDRKRLRRRLFQSMRRDMQRVGVKHGCEFWGMDCHRNNYTPARLELDLAGQQYDIVFIDYLTLFDYQAFNYDLVKGQIEYSRYLKLMAERLGCVVVLLTQLNDDDHVKYGKGPEEAADWWLWWRYGEEERATGQGEIRLDKARSGEPCCFPCRFQPSVMRVDLSAPQRSTAEATTTKKVSEWAAGNF